MQDLLEERSRRIVETAVEPAEQGGFEAVRLRDVASDAGVALGTLYRRFRSKEDLLIAALAVETAHLERRFARQTAQGSTKIERVMDFFGLVNRGLLRRQNLARALIRAVSSGEAGLARERASYHDRIERMLVMALRGEVTSQNGDRVDPQPDPREAQLAKTLNQCWYALRVGWAGGVHDQKEVLEKTRASARLILENSE
ncbi:MAG: TetR family transcriptional regulator [Myxococcota bacterium]